MSLAQSSRGAIPVESEWVLPEEVEAEEALVEGAVELSVEEEPQGRLEREGGHERVELEAVPGRVEVVLRAQGVFEEGHNREDDLDHHHHPEAYE